MRIKFLNFIQILNEYHVNKSNCLTIMPLVETSETDHSTSMRHRLSRKKWCHFIMIISEDLLYEDRLKSGEVVLKA